MLAPRRPGHAPRAPRKSREEWKPPELGGSSGFQGENVEGSRSGVKPIYSPHDPVRQVEPTFGPPVRNRPRERSQVETRVQIPLGLPIPTVAGCSAVLS